MKSLIAVIQLHRISEGKENWKKKNTEQNWFYNGCCIIFLMNVRACSTLDITRAITTKQKTEKKWAANFISFQKWLYRASLCFCALSPKSTKNEKPNHSLNNKYWAHTSKRKWKAYTEENGFTSLWITVNVFALSNKHHECA